MKQPNASMEDHSSSNLDGTPLSTNSHVSSSSGSGSAQLHHSANTTSIPSDSSELHLSRQQLASSLLSSESFIEHLMKVAKMSCQSVMSQQKSSDSTTAKKLQKDEPRMPPSSSSEDAESFSNTEVSSFPFHRVDDATSFISQWDSAKIIYRFLNDTGNVETSINYTQFLFKITENAKRLLKEHGFKPGQRVLLLCDPGSDFIYSFFSALFAGLIAVPSYPPWDERAFEKLFSISRDCTPTGVIISDEYYQQIESDLAEIEEAIQLDYKLNWVPLSNFFGVEGKSSPLETGVEQFSVNAFTKRFQDNVQYLYSRAWKHINRTTDAFLQYTSGSTGSPKGVRVSHGNILSHTNIILQAWEYNKDSSTSWLPPYHDMQLLGTIMCSSAFLMTSNIISPLTFLKNPFLWLKLISKYKSTASGGPNFAYELCVSKITDEQVKELDLSSLQIAYCGAEAVKQETLERFTKKFAPCGFNPDAYYPCYGLAEATLLVAGGVRGHSAMSIQIDADAYLKGKVLPIASPKEVTEQKVNGTVQENPSTMTMVSSGFSNKNVQHVEIVDRDTKKIIHDPYQIGEIWIRRNDASPVGYWNKEDLSRRTFFATTSDVDDHHEYTVTGDLGFFGPNRSLFVSGRSKDLIIIRGRNIYPPDVEEDVHPLSTLLRKGCSACFSIDGADGATEEMIFITELKSTPSKEECHQLALQIQRQILKKTAVLPKEILFLKPKSIPKTTSGKVRRFECRQWYLENKLSVVYRFSPSQASSSNGGHVQESESESSTTKHSLPAQQSNNHEHSFSQSQLQVLITDKLKEKTSLSHIDSKTSFMDLGLDSLKSVELISELSTLLNRDLSPTIVFQYPTIEKLSAHLAVNDGASLNGVHSSLKGKESLSDEPIAIVGMSCRFPDANDYDEFWSNIVRGHNSIHDPTHISDERSSRFSSSGMKAGFLKDIYSFDASYFGISSREAQAMDPQQRIALELAADALFDAGLEKHSAHDTGVFVGASNFDFSHLSFAHAKELDRYLSTGSSASIISNRISYFFDFQGPSMTIDTACSSSLVAIHEACKSLRQGDCSVALAGGVNVIMSEKITDNLEPFLSPDSQCKAFDDSANGYVRGEGGGLLVLKPLSFAERDGDRVHGIIRGSFVSQDGRSNGITAPNQNAQEILLKKLYSSFSIPVNSVDYVEAHGTGTKLGDPIEAHALSRAFKSDKRSVERPLMIGSVKSNIGHLEAAAGIAGCIKALLCLRERTLPASLNFSTPNSLINFDKLGLQVVSKNTHWIKHPDHTRRCGVSSFGFGGTLAHLVLEEPPSRRSNERDTASTEEIRDVPIAISANSQEALSRQVNQFVQWLEEREELSFEDLKSISHSTLTRRQALRHRIVFTGKNREEFVSKMRAYITFPNKVAADVITHRVSTSNAVCFVFPGQGPEISTQCASYLLYASFSESLRQSSALIKRKYGISIDLENAIRCGSWNKENSVENQFVRVCTQIALVALWKEFGVQPSYVCGHSLGEVVAAYTAGHLTLDDVLSIVYHRSKALDDLQDQGIMIIARTTPKEFNKLARDHQLSVSVASYNTSNSITVSGSTGEMQKLAKLFTASSISHKQIEVNVPYHSSLVDGVVHKMEDLSVQGKTASSDAVEMYSTVTGERVEPTSLHSIQHWIDNMKNPVLFNQAINALHTDTRCTNFIEISGREMFSRMLHQIVRHEHTERDIFVIPSAFGTSERISDDLYVLSSLFCRGIPIMWKKLRGYDCKHSDFVSLPRYSWMHNSEYLPQFITHIPRPLSRFDPDLKQLTQEASSTFTTNYETPQTGTIIKSQFALENLCEVLVVRTLRQIGWNFTAGTQISLKKMWKQLNISTQHQRLFTHLLRTVLQKHEILRMQDNDDVQVLKQLPDSLHNLKTTQDASLNGLFESVEESPETELLKRCTTSLGDVLRGTVSSLQVLFPNGSIDTAESLYETSVSSRAYNDLLTHFISDLTQSSSQKLNILEIGGGTAGLTSHVVNNNEIKPHISEYMFTDISRLFTMHAQNKFEELPFMDFAQLDIEKSPLDQGFQPKYDIVLAANVLHATKDLNLTLSNIQELLSPNGILVLLEVTKPSLFLDLTFGLTEGWWRFQDAELRPSYPLLSAAQWQKVMQSCGYTSFFNLTEEFSLPFQSIVVSQCKNNNRGIASVQREEIQRSKRVIQRTTSAPASSARLAQILKEVPKNPSLDDLATFVQNVVAHTLLLKPEEVDPSEKLIHLGMDSLTALELKNIVQKQLNVEIPLASFDEDASVLHIANLVHTQQQKHQLENSTMSDTPVVTLDEHIDNILTDYVDDIPTAPPAILGMGLGEAPFTYRQSEMLTMCQEFYRDKVEDPKDLRTIQAIFSGSQIETRHSVIDFYKLDTNDLVKSFQKRNEIYEREAIKLAEKSARAALENWGGDVKDITHVVSVSTTGEQIPGIDFLLVERLGLSNNVERVGVNLMGCFGALPGLKTALSFARLSKKNRVLLVSTEICSPHIESEPTKENFVGAAIFADGSGAAVIGCGPYHDYEKPKYQILKTQSRAVPQSTDKMGWKVTDEGWKLTLSKEIPGLIHDAMGSVADRLLGSVSRESTDWALHAGGKAILLATESALGIGQAQTKDSWDVMRRYGNMSSSTIMHVLHEFCHGKQSVERKKLLTAVAFGPGLTVEAALLKRIFE